MNFFASAFLVSALLAAEAYNIGSVTLAPIAGLYEQETFTTYLAIEQEGYPGTRKDMTTPAAYTCMTNRLISLLPGVRSEDIVWDTASTHFTYGIWNHQQTAFYQFDITYVPDSIGFKGMPNANVPDYNGVYSETKNCKNCFPSKDVVYLRYKDIIAEDITSGKFLPAIRAACTAESNFATTNYAYVSFSDAASETIGSPVGAHGHNLHHEYVWFLMFLLVPVSIFLYRRVYHNDADKLWISAYEADRAAEIAAAGNAGDAYIASSSEVRIEEGVVAEEADHE